MNFAGGSVEYQFGSEMMVVAVNEPFHFSIPSNAGAGVCVTAEAEKRRSPKAERTMKQNLAGNHERNMGWIINGRAMVGSNQRLLESRNTNQLTTISRLP
jgi:hypothetical protein